MAARRAWSSFLSAPIEGRVKVETASAQALKEWGAIEQALAAGEIAVLVRKGGLWERRDDFEMEHRRFWIFPTLYHQNPRELRPDLSWALEAAEAADPGAAFVRLEHFAEVSDAFRIENLDAALALTDLQALTPETIQNRFHYRYRPYVHALLLRVYRRNPPHVVPNTTGYEGCVSWVELDEELTIGPAAPVLDDERFDMLRDLLKRRLAEYPGISEV